MTGDGTNDGPALAEADVGFSMGSGTQVAKEASDIVILDDNFKSMVAAISWGRNVYDAISEFLVFQLTVNVVAVFSVFIGSASVKETPLQPIQLLWVNLIMDSFASLALATSPPTPELLLRQPYKRKAPLLSKFMVRQILGHALFQLGIVLAILYVGDDIFGVPNGRGRDDDWKDECKRQRSAIGVNITQAQFDDEYPESCSQESMHFSIIFNVFVWMQLFNEINARHIHGELNVFKGFFINKLFVAIWVGTMGMQAILVEFGGAAFSTAPLKWNRWLGCIAAGMLELLWNPVLFLFRPEWVPDWMVNATVTAVDEEKELEPEPDPIHNEKPDVVPHPPSPRTAERARPLNSMVKSGWGALRTQMRIVGMFRQAGTLNLRRRVIGHRMSITAGPMRTETAAAAVAGSMPLSAAGALWNVSLHRIRLQIRVARAFASHLVRRGKTN